MNQNNWNDLATVYKACAEPLRLQVLRILKGGSFGVQELADICLMPQPGMSHHLKILSKSHLVEFRKEGNFIFYRRPSQSISPLIESVLNAVDQIELDEASLEAIARIYKRRADSSLEFFAKYAHQFREKQMLICDFDQYGQGIIELIEMYHGSRDTALEIGPGDGDLLKFLHQKFKKTIVLDNSEAMLQRTKGYCKQHRLKNIDFHQGDISELGKGSISADLVVLNMVLHHLPSPKQSFEVIYDLLSNQGCLLIADLCQHEQEWVRESCGDLWLGFEPEELSSWALSCGFRPRAQSFIGLKNGFHIQLRLFFK